MIPLATENQVLRRRRHVPFTIGGGVDIPDGTYTASLEKVEEGESQFGKYRKWHWLLEANGELQTISSVTSTNTGPQSKSYQWLTALIGRTPKAGETLEDPIGKRAILQLVKNEKGFPTVVSVAPFVEPQQVEAGIPR
jgi:hypothetical protein